MNREILFKGKRVEGGKWIYGYLSFFYIDNPGKGRIFSPKEVRSFDVISETVGQYTGLTDKNGVKIFEGDVIRHHYKNPAANGYTSDRGVVKWDCKECFFYRTSLYGKDKTISAGCIYEVIGNIYDNPELMEDKENE